MLKHNPASNSLGLRYRAFTPVPLLAPEAADLVLLQQKVAIQETW